MKEIILDRLKSTRDFLSGSALSAQLGVTRAAVWKAVQSLRQAGYSIEAVPNRGYRLAGPSDVLNAFEIKAALRNGPPAEWIQQVHFADSAGSTNQLARQAVETGAPSGSVFVAACQTAGRGRRGKKWLSDHTQGLWFSILLRPDQPPARLSSLTLFAGYCVALALRQEMGADVGIKWPNDVVSKVNNRKLCGILTEMIIEEQTTVAVVIGIGLNVNTRLFPAELTGTATSLYQECGREFRRVDVLAAVLRQFAGQYESFIAGTGWLDSYKALCLTLGREILVIPGSGESFTGRAVGLDAAGELIVEDDSRRCRTVISGEVSIRGLTGDAQNVN